MLVTRRSGYLLSTDPALLDVQRVQQWLSTDDAYWAAGRTFEQNQAAIAAPGSAVVQTLRDDLAARGLKRFLLATKTAHGVYAPLGFEPVETGRWMVCDLQSTAAELAP